MKRLDLWRLGLGTCLGLTLVGATGLAYPKSPQGHGVLAAMAAIGAMDAKAPLTAAEKTHFITEYAKILRRDYVFEDQGKAYEQALLAKLKAGAYDGITDGTAFANQVHEDVQAVHPDKHLSIHFWELPLTLKAGAGPQKGQKPFTPLEAADLRDGLLYVKINLFTEGRDMGQKVRRLVLAHPEARALVIDARDNHGGGLDLMDALFPLVFDKETQLIRMEKRGLIPLDRIHPPSLRSVKSPKGISIQDHYVVPETTDPRLKTLPIYFLTSNHSFSAAEHMALALKRTHRGILVGGATGGGAHFGRFDSIGRFKFFVPEGRGCDPQTGWDWEGHGVEPDLKVAPERAYQTVLEDLKAKGR